ncbi:MAG: nucleotide exchange factor GrpE [Eubacteriaceae bacterium]|nr:nucleotide exchange factor GrpE [Eubacteriaceae bacterium]
MTVEKENLEELTEEVTENTVEENTQKTEVDILNEKLKEKEESYLRLYADFDNYRKRAAKEKLESYTDATAQVMGKLLPVIDNLARAISANTEETPFSNGVKMVSKQLDDVLSGLGLEMIASLGEQFDPNFHYAVMTDSIEDKEDNEIVEVMQEGYLFKGKVIRPAMVKVNQK